MAVSGLAATSMCGFSPCCSQLGQAYFLRTWCRRSNRPGIYSTCQLSSAPISWRGWPQQGQARSSAFSSCTWVVTGRFSKLAIWRRPVRFFTRRSSYCGSTFDGTSSGWTGFLSNSWAKSNNACASSCSDCSRSARGPQYSFLSWYSSFCRPALIRSSRISRACGSAARQPIVSSRSTRPTSAIN